MSLMLKSLSILIILVSSVVANEQIDKKAMEYAHKKFKSNDRVQIKDIKISMKKEIKSGWYGYAFDISAIVGGKNANAKDVIFTDGNFVTPDLQDMSTGNSYQDMMKPLLDAKYYKSEHLIAGNANAKHKIVVFSDPLCPFCIEYMPELIQDVMKKPDTFALYYYHFPLLRLHPDANVITKAMHIATAQGVKDVTLKTYQGEFHKYLKPGKNPDQTVLSAFNKVLGTNITLAQINDPMVHKAISYDVMMGDKAMVEGTPTVFFDGAYDKSRYKYDKVK